MIVRRSLVCDACHTKTLTRTQLGPSQQQSHTFRCPHCGIEIGFVLDLEPERGRCNYRSPKNAAWSESEEGTAHTLTFASGLPVPQMLANVPAEPDIQASIVRAGFSPFISSVQKLGKPGDFEEYADDEHWRTRGIVEFWPFLERLVNHFERGNDKLFDAEAASADFEPDSPTRPGRLLLLERLAARFLRLYTRYTPRQRGRVRQRIALARSISQPLFAELATRYENSGRLGALWREIWNIRRALMRNYQALAPIIYTRYWKQEHQDLSALTISDKHFDDLRQLYIDCFETFCRLMVLAIAFEMIIDHNGLDIPTKKGSMDLWQFDALPNASKRDHLSRYPIGDLLVAEIDPRLRNGIGHHSAHYVPDTDLIEYETERDAKVVVDRLPYTVFCDRVLRLYTGFELATLYFHVVHVQVDGVL